MLKKVLLWVNLDGLVKIEIGMRVVVLVHGKRENTSLDLVAEQRLIFERNGNNPHCQVYY